MSYFVLSRIWVLLQKWNKSHQNSGSAISALQAMRFPEGLLNRVKTPLDPPKMGGSQTFYSRDLMPICLHGEHQTGTRRFAIEQNRASAADSMLTTDMCAGKSQLMTQKITE